MTLAERRQQVKRDRDELSPMHSYIDPRAEKPTGTPRPRPTEPADRGPAANRSATPFGAQATGNPTWVSAYATAYPATLSIGGQLQLPTGTTASSVSGMWLYVRDEAGNYVHQQEIKRANGDPSGRYLDNGAWCYGWWPSNAYPADQCFWWSGSTLGGHLEDGKKYYAWIFLTGTDGSSSPGGTTSPLVEAFYTPDIPGAQAGICTCYAQAHRADPVNTATGMFFEQLTDASLVGPGVPLALERTYRSDSAAAGRLRSTRSSRSRRERSPTGRTTGRRSCSRRTATGRTKPRPGRRPGWSKAPVTTS